MITEDYVNKEIALLLRKKGFDEPTLYHYNGDNKEPTHTIDYDLLKNSELKEFCSAAPTIQMALKWLREVHNIYIAVNITYSEEPKLFPPEYYVYINNTLTGESLIKEVCSLVQDKTLTPKGFKYSETACEAAIKYALENLI